MNTTLKTGTVKYPAGQAFPDSYKPGAFKQNLVLTMEDGTEERIWFASGRMPHAGLTKGSTVQVLFEQRDGKTIRKLIENSTNNQPQPSQPTQVHQPSQAHQTTESSNQGLSNEQKRAIAEYINQQGDLLAYCFDTAVAKFQNKVQSEESSSVLGYNPLPVS